MRGSDKFLWVFLSEANSVYIGTVAAGRTNLQVSRRTEPNLGIAVAGRTNLQFSRRSVGFFTLRF